MSTLRQQMAQLKRQRSELEQRAAVLEHEAHGLSEVTQGDRRHLIESEARVLREQAREIGRKWADLAEEISGDR
jgi:hypothetical protein